MFGMLKVGGNIDRLHARPDCRRCAKTSTDGAATFSTAWIVPTEARAENTEISPTPSGQRHGLFSSVFNSVGSRPSDHYFRSVCLSVCLFVQSFSQPSLI